MQSVYFDILSYRHNFLSQIVNGSVEIVALSIDVWNAKNTS